VTPDAQFSEMLARFSPEIAAQAEEVLPRLQRAFPGTPQLVYAYPKSVVVSFSPSERGSEGVVALAVDPSQVRLYFSKDLPDPKGLLEGSGTKVRSVPLKAPSDLDRGDVHDLIQSAIKHCGLTFSGKRPGPMIFKSESKKTKKGS
jgi:hypothetical protein